MHHRLRTSVFTTLFVAGLFADAQAAEYSTSEEAVSALYPGERIAEWTRTIGDFDGDGINDLALLLTIFSDNEPMQTRLVVLAGSRSGGYSKLSASSKYCTAQKFFDLDSKGASLNISAVHKADANEISSETLQFRFNRRVGDLELVGRENVWESYTDESSGRLSVNYITGKSIEYTRRNGLIKETRRTKPAVSHLITLNGFNCDDWMNRDLY